MAILIVFSLGLGMCFSLIVNAKCVRAKQLMILLGLLPWAIPRVVSGLMWDWIFDGNYGILNFICSKLGLIDNYQWWFTFGPYVSLSLCAIVSVWRLAPFVTHLYSGMSSLHRVNAFRVLGVVECAYLFDELTVELIADGKHLPPELLKMIVRCKDRHKICTITDSLRCTGKQKVNSTSLEVEKTDRG